MRVRLSITLTISLVVGLLSFAGGASAEPADPDCAVRSATVVADSGFDDRYHRLAQLPQLQHMFDEQGANHVQVDALSIMAAGLTDEAVYLMEQNGPEFPGGAPIPTYAPPLPAERGHGAVPNWNCGRSFASYAVYSWWSTGICLMVGVAATPLATGVCEFISWVGGAFVPWNNVCQMRAESPSGNLAMRLIIGHPER
ncbi:hypothetical protein [Actinokineospora xionganensis]|uniref:Uncharacterized protein n=1 Tax=Actinokineospora xionganensis TaxID=2684470 RepID=A0ABR7L5N7_9PSEU|nr:hypothetical protein [Actinokineospora xionganensis]MBC6448006.1 hypothetical protein [Actinokineospora xionganensis]